MAAVTAPPRIHGDGHNSQAWRRWLDNREFPSWSLNGERGPAQRLVVVAPHPDDEVLACGGLITQQAARGSEVLLVAVTDGEASHADTGAKRRKELATQRRQERHSGLKELGLNQAAVHALHLSDGQVKAQGRKLRTELSGLLRASDIVLTTWEHDGHPDHDATGHATRHACLAAGCRFLSAPVWMWHWASLGDGRVPWHRMHRLALSPEMHQRKAAALAAHVSQLAPRSPTLGAVLGASIQERAAWRHEYFFL